MFKIGECGMCGFQGILCAPRGRFTADEAIQMAIGETEGDSEGGYQLKAVQTCLGCAKTPEGAKSDNQRHERLPAEEYELDKESERS